MIDGTFECHSNISRDKFELLPECSWFLFVSKSGWGNANNDYYYYNDNNDKKIMMKRIIIIIIIIIKACFADDAKHFLNEHSKVLPKVRAYISFF